MFGDQNFEGAAEVFGMGQSLELADFRCRWIGKEVCGDFCQELGLGLEFDFDLERDFSRSSIKTFPNHVGFGLGRCHRHPASPDLSRVTPHIPT